MNSSLLTWKKAPFTRIIFPYLAGIIIQDHLVLPRHHLIISCLVVVSFLIIFSFIPVSSRLKFLWLRGSLLNILITLFACIITSNIQQEILPDKDLTVNSSSVIIGTVVEPFREKNKYRRGVIQLESICNEDSSIMVNGKILAYIPVNLTAKIPPPGSVIMFSIQPLPISFPGNPGTFNYKLFCSRQGIHNQVFLNNDSYIIIQQNKISYLDQFLYKLENTILRIIRKNIPGKTEAGLAEALLIGYKNDLDQELVQSYSNTGVVHVIAISGLHLGIIYWILGFISMPLKKRKQIAIARPFIILTGLWIFSLLAGASPSVLRSALMFSCIVIGESLDKKSSIYNSLAASAFILLAINPLWVWDTGFQLSYAAVLSIIIFQRPVYNLFYIPNRIADNAWKMCAVTIAAQILTTPVIIYNFHQFPLNFLVTNFIAIPLSSIILLGEILLCILSPFDLPALLTGELVSVLIHWMNGFIRIMDSVPYTNWKSLFITGNQCLFLYIIIYGFFLAFISKTKWALPVILFPVLGFSLIRWQAFRNAEQQQALIVFNIHGKTAIDIVNGRKATGFYYDSATRVHQQINPSRILFRYSLTNNQLAKPVSFTKTFIIKSTIIRVIDNKAQEHISTKAYPSVLVLSQNSQTGLEHIFKQNKICFVIADGSNSRFMVAKWKRICGSFRVPFYNSNEKGAIRLNF